MARRPLAAALVLSVGALALTGCLPTPPPLPQGPVTTVPTAVPGSSAPSAPGASTGLGETVEVDDLAGDAWAFAVTGVEEAPVLESGEPEPGTRFVAIVLEGQRLEGTWEFMDLFEIWMVGSDGVDYHWADTFEATAQDDLYFADGDSLDGARALIQLPEGVEPELVVLRSQYGHPQVEDVVVDVR